MSPLMLTRHRGWTRAPAEAIRVTAEAPCVSAARGSSSRLLAVTLLLGVALAGCGKSLPTETRSRGASVTTVAVAGTGQLAASGTVTKNTTRIGGPDPLADAAAVALATYPGLTEATRPQAVVLVDDRDWPVALAAAALASAPLRAPLLYSEGSSLPALSAQTLAALKPRGAALLGGAQVIDIGPAAAPAGYRTRVLRGKPAGRESQAALAAQVERLVEAIHGGAPRRVVVIGAQGPPALAMPAAGLAAESGAPILPVDAASIPPATQRVLRRLRRPVIYAVGPPAAVSHTVLAKLARLGPVRRIQAGVSAGELRGNGEAAASNAIAVARFADGHFGWGVEQPGHGLVFANASRPLDAPAAALLSASGDYAPMLLLESPSQVPPVLSRYLSDIRPGYTEAPESEYPPVRGAYNRGWLIGDGEAIAPVVQAELDAMLEIAPQSASGSVASSAQTTEPSPAESAPAEPSTTTPGTTSHTTTTP
jgi:hypothetical protein